MCIDKLANYKVLRTDEALQFDLLCFLIKEDVNFVLEIQSFVEEQGLDVVLLGKELLKFCQFVLFAH